MRIICEGPLRETTERGCFLKAISLKLELIKVLCLTEMTILLYNLFQSQVCKKKFRSRNLANHNQ